MENLPPEQSASFSLAPGQRVGAGRFVLKRALGQGGMGMVWLAQDEHLQEPVALKFLPPQIRFDPAAISMLRKETSRSRKLSHPNIVRIHDFHQHDGEDPFIAMEFVDGQTLHALRFQQPNELFSWDKLATWLRQLCNALDYAHSEKIVHRDLKPSNLMLDSGGRLKLADFGIAATVSDSVTRLTGTSGGTPAYMSPQQVDGKPPQPADDIYSLGATLYELLTGTPPFYTGQIVHQVLHNPPTTLGERLTETGAHNEIPPDVEAMIMACLAKEREQRPQSARAIADWIGLQPTPHPKSLEATVTPQEGSAPAEAERRVSRYALGIFAVFVLLGLLGAGVWFLKTKASKQTVATGGTGTQTPAEQVVFTGNFENFHGDGDNSKVMTWGGGRLAPGYSGAIVEEGGKHFLRIEHAKPNTSRPAYGMVWLQPEWKTMRFSARLRTRNLSCAADSQDSGATLFIGWWDDTSWYDFSVWTDCIKTNCDWTVVDKVVSIPPGSKHVGFAPQLAAASGIADFDEIKVSVVEANPVSPEPDILRPIADGPYELINMEGQLPLEAENGSEQSGAGIWQGLFCGTVEQQWIFTYASGGFYTIRNAANGLYLTDPGGATTNETGLQQQAEASGAARDQQLWLVQPGQDGFAFFNKACGLGMNDSSNSHDFKGKIILYGRRDDPVGLNSIWFLRATPSVIVHEKQNGSEPGTFVMEDFENFPVGKVFNGNYREGTVLSEHGNHFLRVESRELEHYHGFTSFFLLPEDWQQLTVSGRVRTRNLKTNGGQQDGARVNFTFYDRPDRGCYWGLAGDSVKQNSDWVVESGSIERDKIPPAADRMVHLDLALMNASGVADFDDLKLTVFTKSTP